MNFDFVMHIMAGIVAGLGFFVSLYLAIDWWEKRKATKKHIFYSMSLLEKILLDLDKEDKKYFLPETQPEIDRMQKELERLKKTFASFLILNLKKLRNDNIELDRDLLILKNGINERRGLALEIGTFLLGVDYQKQFGEFNDEGKGYLSRIQEFLRELIRKLSKPEVNWRYVLAQFERSKKLLEDAKEVSKQPECSS